MGGGPEEDWGDLYDWEEESSCDGLEFRRESSVRLSGGELGEDEENLGSDELGETPPLTKTSLPNSQLRAKASQTATRSFMDEYISEHQGKLVHDVMAKPGMLTSKVEYLQDSDGNRLVSGKTVLMISRVEPSASQQTRRTGMQVSPNAQSSQPSRVVHDIPKPSKLKPDFLKEFLEGNGPLTLRCKDIEAAVKFIEHLGKSADVQELIDKGKLKIDYNQAPFNKPGSKELIADAIDKATGPNPQQSVQLDEENTPPKYRS